MTRDRVKCLHETLFLVGILRVNLNLGGRGESSSQYENGRDGSSHMPESSGWENQRENHRRSDDPKQGGAVDSVFTTEHLEIEPFGR